MSFLCYTFLNNLRKNNRNSIWIQLILFSKRDIQQIKMFNLNCLLSSPVCLITGNDKRETLWSIVSDCALLFNWFSILVWETLSKRGERIMREAGKVGLMCQHISGEFLDKWSTQTQRHRHTRFPKHNDAPENTNTETLILHKHLREYDWLESICCILAVLLTSAKQYS